MTGGWPSTHRWSRGAGFNLALYRAILATRSSPPAQIERHLADTQPERHQACALDPHKHPAGLACPWNLGCHDHFDAVLIRS